MEIQVKEGGTGLHKTIREVNLVYKGLITHEYYDTVNRISYLHCDEIEEEDVVDFSPV